MRSLAWFYRKWILTNARPPQSHDASACKVSAQSSNARLSCCDFTDYFKITSGKMTFKDRRLHQRRVITHSQGRLSKSMGKAKIWPPPPLNLLTDRHQNIPTWLRRGYIPFSKISSRSDEGFRFCVCAISRIKLLTRWKQQLKTSSNRKRKYDRFAHAQEKYGT